MSVTRQVLGSVLWQSFRSTRQTARTRLNSGVPECTCKITRHGHGQLLRGFGTANIPRTSYGTRIKWSQVDSSSSSSCAVVVGQKRTRSSLRQVEVPPSPSTTTTTTTSSWSNSNARRPFGNDERGNYRPDTRLPVVKDQRMMYLGIAAVAITAWTFFVMWAMSAEKASSTVVRTLAFNLRSSPVVKQVMGHGVRPKPFLFSTEPWVHGTVNTIQGIVDIHFRVQADNGRQGTVYFKSERPNKSARFETVEFRLVMDGAPEPIDLKDISLIS